MQICVCMKRNKLKKNGRCIGKEIVSHKNKIQVKLKKLIKKLIKLKNLFYFNSYSILSIFLTKLPKFDKNS